MKVLNFNKFREKKVAEKVAKMRDEEIERRKFCMERAVWLDETRPENIVAVAERIYNYIWGSQS